MSRPLFHARRRWEWDPRRGNAAAAPVPTDGCIQLTGRQGEG
jgi:hypothetical protein